MTTTTTAAGFWATARRPKWIAALVLVLVVAAVFAALGRWQLERSFLAGQVNQVDTETPVSLVELSLPGKPVTGDQLGRVVTVSGELVSDDTLVLADRHQHGESGYWTVGRMLVDAPGAGEPASLVVAFGWAPTEAAARAATLPVELVEVRGRYLPSEPPRIADLETGRQTALSIAEFVNTWADYAGLIYAGYLILEQPPAGLESIDAPPPLPEEEVNLLNLFYALEWAIFAGFAIYLWYRLVKDEVEKQAEEQATAATVD